MHAPKIAAQPDLLKYKDQLLSHFQSPAQPARPQAVHSICHTPVHCHACALQSSLRVLKATRCANLHEVIMPLARSSQLQELWLTDCKWVWGWLIGCRRVWEGSVTSNLTLWASKGMLWVLGTRWAGAPSGRSH